MEEIQVDIQGAEAELKKLTDIQSADGVVSGITLPMRTPFIMTCIAGAVQGAYLAFFNAKMQVMGGMGLFAIPSFIDPKDSLLLIHFLVAIAISFVLGFVLTQLFMVGHKKSLLKKSVCQLKRLLLSKSSQLRLAGKWSHSKIRLMLFLQVAQWVKV